MNEGDIARRAFEYARDVLEAGPGRGVKRIVIRCGSLEQIDGDTLASSWRQLCQGSKLADTHIQLHMDNAKARCATCRNEFELQDDTVACPKCRCEQFTVIHQPPVIESLEMI